MVYTARCQSRADIAHALSRADIVTWSRADIVTWSRADIVTWSRADNSTSTLLEAIVASL